MGRGVCKTGFILALVFLFSVPDFTFAADSAFVSKFREAYVPIYELETRCRFLATQDRAELDDAITKLMKVVEDMDSLQPGDESDSQTASEAADVGAAVRELACANKAQAIVISAKPQIVDLAARIVPAYLKTQSTYVAGSFYGVSTAHYLAKRCPGIDEDGMAALEARYQDAREGIAGLISETQRASLDQRAEEAMSEENFGPCGDKTTQHLTDALENSNFLVSRLKFLSDFYQ